jgi:hypothetical protein
MIYGIKENKSFENVIFTYVVDSDEALNDWADNVEGNDYSCVLIKSGTWTCTKNLNLTNCGTKVVIGEVGSKLVFNLDISSVSSSGISYSVFPDNNEFFMFNVHISVSRQANVIGFNGCINLYNCSVEANGVRAVGFYKSENLINCNAVANATGTEYGVPFYYCNGVQNCIGSVTSETGHAMAYSNCEKLNDCKVKDLQSNEGTAYGFHSCKVLSGCSIENDGINNSIQGFCNCEKLHGCKSVAKGISEGYAFKGCDNVVSCEGSGGYAFYECTGVLICLATNNTIAKQYNSCSNLGSYNASYAYANTPNGGFNF